MVNISGYQQVPSVGGRVSVWVPKGLEKYASCRNSFCWRIPQGAFFARKSDGNSPDWTVCVPAVRFLALGTSSSASGLTDLERYILQELQKYTRTIDVVDNNECAYYYGQIVPRALLDRPIEKLLKQPLTNLEIYFLNHGQETWTSKELLEAVKTLPKELIRSRFFTNNENHGAALIFGALEHPRAACNLELLRFLLKSHPGWEKLVDKQGNSLLHVAVGNVGFGKDFIKYLGRCGVNCVNNYQSPPMSRAISCGNVDHVETLFEMGALDSFVGGDVFVYKDTEMFAYLLRQAKFSKASKCVKFLEEKTKPFDPSQETPQEAPRSSLEEILYAKFQKEVARYFANHPNEAMVQWAADEEEEEIPDPSRASSSSSASRKRSHDNERGSSNQGKKQK